MGYAAIADLGMQQALVRMVADRHALDAHDEIDRLVSTTVATFAALGVLGAAGSWPCPTPSPPGSASRTA